MKKAGVFRAGRKGLVSKTVTSVEQSSPEKQEARTAPSPSGAAWTVRVLGARRVVPSRGALLAHADVEVSAMGETLRIYGLSVLQNERGTFWVGLPQRKGEKKYFPLLTASKGLRARIEQAVLARFDALKKEEGAQ